MRRLQKHESEILKNLEELENKKRFFEEELAKPEVYSIGEKAKNIKQQIDQCAANIEIKTSEWEKIVSEINLNN